jgi:hypothetical protein
LGEDHLRADPLVLDPTISEGRTLHLRSHGDNVTYEPRKRSWLPMDRNTVIIDEANARFRQASDL